MPKFWVYARYTYRSPTQTEPTLWFERYCVKILVRAIQTEIDYRWSPFGMITCPVKKEETRCVCSVDMTNQSGGLFV